MHTPGPRSKPGSAAMNLSVECDDHSSSSDQLSSGRAEVRCPLVSCMPEVARNKTSAASNQQPMLELASLHAALSREGVPILRSPNKLQQHQQQWHPQQQQQQQQPAVGSLANNSAAQQHARTPQLAKEDVQSTLSSMGKGIALVSAQLDQMLIRTTQRPQACDPATSRAGPATLGRAPQHVAGSDSFKHTPRAAMAAPPPPPAAAAAGAEQVQSAHSSESSLSGSSGSSACSSVSQPCQHTSAVDTALLKPVIKGMLPQAGPQQQRQQQHQQQRQQELLGVLDSGKASMAAVAALAQQVRSSSALQRLQQPQPQALSSQDLAARGLQQLADITDTAQLLNSAVSMQQKCALSTQQTLTALHDVFTQHPQAMDAARLQQQHSSEVRALREELEVLQRALAAKGIAEQNILGAAIRNAHTPRDRQLLQLQQEKDAMHQEVILLRLQRAYLQQQLQQQQSEEAHGDASSLEELSPVVDGQRYDQLRSGQRVSRSLLLPLQAAAQASGLAAASGSSGGGGDKGGSSRGSDRGGSSGGNGSSRSWTPDSSSSSGSVSAHLGLQLHRQQGPQQGLQQRQQPLLVQQQQQPGLPVNSSGSSTTVQLERELAAGRLQAPQLEVQLQGMRSPLTLPTDAFNNAGSAVTPPGQLSKQVAGDLPQPVQQPFSASPATSACASPAAVVQRLRAELQQAHSALARQQQQYAGMRVNMETAHKRQLDTERRRLETAQQQYDWVKQQNEQLTHQLQAARAQHQEQPTGRRRTSSGSSSRSSTSSGSSSGKSAPAERQQQQQRLLQQESVIRELTSQLQQARELNATLQQRLDTAVAHASAYKDAVQQQAPRLLQAESALQDLAAAKERSSVLAQQVQELQQQASGARQAQASAEGAAQECKRQLTAADAERAVLRDRIRELADKVSRGGAGMLRSQDAHGSNNGSRSSGSRRSSAGSSMASGSGTEAWPHHQQQQEQEQDRLSAACAELQQQASVLRGQLGEAEAKQERLQVVNAQLQERLSRLMAECAAREAIGSSTTSSMPQQPRPQQQLSQLEQVVAALQHDKQHLQQQVEQLQQQLAETPALGAPQATAAEASGRIPDQQQQQRQGHEQQQQQDAEGLDSPTAEQLAAELEDRTQELLEWQIHADALEKDLEMLKGQVLAADGLQQQLDATAAQLAASRSQQGHLQQELEAARSRVRDLEYQLHGVSKERSVLKGRVDGLEAELAEARQGAGDLRVRLEHFTGPKGPQARVRQLEGVVHTLQRKLEAADSRAGAAAAQVSELKQQLGRAEDQIVELEGHVCVLEDELARRSGLPQ